MFHIPQNIVLVPTHVLFYSYERKVAQSASTNAVKLSPSSSHKRPKESLLIDLTLDDDEDGAAAVQASLNCGQTVEEVSFQSSALGRLSCAEAETVTEHGHGRQTRPCASMLRQDLGGEFPFRCVTTRVRGTEF